MDVNLRTPGIIDVNLKPGETFIAERGAMSSCGGGIIYKPIETGIKKSILRWLGGESFFSIVQFDNISGETQNLKLRYDIQQNAWFHHNSTQTDVLTIDLKKVNGDLIIKSGEYFASSSGVKVSMFIDSNIGRSIFGFGNLIKQRISGNGIVFVQKNRWLELDEVKIENGNSMTIDPKEVYAYSLGSLNQQKGFSFSSFLTGEGFSSYKFMGPALIYTYKKIPVGYSQGSNRLLGIVLVILFFIFMLTQCT
jgi:uncharacterized protein (AIM24 family)